MLKTFLKQMKVEMIKENENDHGECKRHYINFDNVNIDCFYGIANKNTLKFEKEQSSHLLFKILSKFKI